MAICLSGRLFVERHYAIEHKHLVSNTYPAKFQSAKLAFAPFWTLLFIMMGIAAGMIWNRLKNQKEELVKKGLLFFTVQLLLNALWSLFILRIE